MAQIALSPSEIPTSRFRWQRDAGPQALLSSWRSVSEVGTRGLSAIPLLEEWPVLRWLDIAGSRGAKGIGRSTSDARNQRVGVRLVVHGDDSADHGQHVARRSKAPADLCQHLVRPGVPARAGQRMDLFDGPARGALAAPSQQLVNLSLRSAGVVQHARRRGSVLETVPGQRPDPGSADPGRRLPGNSRRCGWRPQVGSKTGTGPGDVRTVRSPP